MKNSKFIGKVEYRKFYDGDIWMNRYGSDCFREHNDKYQLMGKSVHGLKIQVDSEGNKYVRTKDKGRIPVDYIVIKCFCPPKPIDGKSYEIFHKDGNKDNCSASNLEWKLATHIKDSSTGLEKVNVFNDVWVWENGDIYEGGKKLDYHNHIYDSDIDLNVAVEPNVIINGKRVSVESMMQKADFVKGNNNRSSVILHKDNDFMNCSADNMEYVECDDPVYENYYDHKVANMREINIKENGGEFPDVFQPRTTEEKKAEQIKKNGKGNS